MSSLTTLARPYAKAAFGLARGGKALAEWDQLLSGAAAAVSEPSMAALIETPHVGSNQVVAILLEVLGKPETGNFGNFISVLGSNGRLSLLPEIAVLFQRLREDAEQRLSVRVVSAIALDEGQSERLKKALGARFEREIDMHQEIDAAVLGGAVIYAGDQVIDGSLRGRLQKLQASLAR